MTLDITLLRLLNHLAGRSFFFDALIIFFAKYFQYLLVAIFLLLLFFSGYAKLEKFRIFYITTLSALIARLGATELIRFFYHRPRPFSVLPVRQLIFENEWSFPSGHSAFFFATATTIYFYNKKWGIGFFIAALLMNISRIIAGVHYPSDILGGAIVGTLTGYAVFYFAEKLKTKGTARI